jgi:hypothetical protein
VLIRSFHASNVVNFAGVVDDRVRERHDTKANAAAWEIDYRLQRRKRSVAEAEQFGIITRTTHLRLNVSR